MITRTLLVSSVIAVAGLGLIGVGSNATFTQDTLSSQQITAGAMNVVIADGIHPEGTTLTMTAIGPTGSEFTTGDQLVTITNKGNIAVDAYWFAPGLSMGSSSQSAALATQVYVCVFSSGQTLYNGPVANAPTQQVTGPLAPNATDDYTVNYYAGEGVATKCGVSTVPTLTNPAQGGVITPTIKLTYVG